MSKKSSKSPKRKVSTQGGKRNKQTRTVKTTNPSANKSQAASGPSAPSASSKAPSKAATEMPFGKMNYILLLVGVGIIALGFFLMSLDGFVDATEFSVSLYIAPVVVVAGFLEIIYAIMYQPKQQEGETSPS